MSTTIDEDEPLIPDRGPFPTDALAPLPVPSGLYDRVLENTLEIVDRRRHLRRAGGILLLAVTFGTGVGVGLGGTQSVPEDRAPPPPAGAADVVTVVTAPEGTEDPADLEVRAEHPDSDRAGTLLRRAGDLYLSAHRDIRAATRCYARYLRLEPEGRAPEPADTWLLASIKRSL